MTALPAPSVALDDQLCFALYAASRAVTARYRPMLDAIGLTYPQYLVMMLLWESDHQTVGQLGARLALDSGTLSPLLKRLEHQGLIRRDRGTDDERTVWISPTAAGAALESRVADLPQRLACALDLSIEEFVQLHHLLTRIRGTAATAGTI